MTTDNEQAKIPSLAYHTMSLTEADFELNLDNWQNMLNILSELFSSPSVLLNQSNVHGIEVISASSNPENPYPKGAKVPLDCNIYCHHVVNSNTLLRVQDAAEEDIWQDNPELTEDGFCSYIGVPLNWPDGRVFGTLCVMDKKRNNYPELYLKILDQFKQIIDYELALVDRNKQLKALSMLDEVTQLYNRRGLFEAANHLIALAERAGNPILVVYLDVDNLKTINDTLGHETGDKLIDITAKAIRTVMRAQDIACRSGGDEFILLAMVDDQLAQETMIDRLNRSITAARYSVQSVDGETTHSISLSIGTHLEKIVSIEHLKKCIDIADQAMYEIKQQKKNTD